MIINPLKEMEEFKYLEETYCIKVLFRNKLRADLIQDMLPIIWCRIFCLPFCYTKI
jgi:hypothetical protein